MLQRGSRFTFVLLTIASGGSTKIAVLVASAHRDGGLCYTASGVATTCNASGNAQFVNINASAERYVRPSHRYVRQRSLPICYDFQRPRARRTTRSRRRSSSAR